MIKLSIVIPVFNSSTTIQILVQELYSLYPNAQIILVNDGSSDNTWQIIKNISKLFPITALNLAKNFGENNAVMAGYNYATGDYIVTIDDDFQNPPLEIQKLIREAREGYDVVYVKFFKKRHSFFRNILSKLHNWVAPLILNSPKGLYISTFRLISKKLKNEIIKYPGPFPYIDGLILTTTRNIGSIEVEHHQRPSGRSHYTFFKLLGIWSHMFFNFSLMPLRIIYILGILLILAGAFSFFTLNLQTSIIFIIAGVQMLGLGLVGEYLGRSLLTINKVPQFSIGEIINGQINIHKNVDGFSG